MLTPKNICVAIVTVGLFAILRAQESSDDRLLKEFGWRSVGPVNMGGRIHDIEAVESDLSIVYTVRLTANGRTLTSPFAGVADPNR